MFFFLCFFVFPLTSAIQKTRNSMFGHSLLASPYDETSVRTLWECYKLCYDDKENCASINYDMKKERCKRMKVSHVNLPRELVKMKNSVYADIREGCASKPHPLGMEDGRIQDTSITASSTYSSPGHNPHHARLNNQPVKEEHIGAWGAADLQTKGEYLQVDLGRVTWITHVATQGRPIEHAQWVTEYSVEYSLTGEQWQSYLDGNGVVMVFPGNFDQTTVVKNELFPVIKTRYVRIVVQASNGNVVMRAELYGLECSFT
ncbi:neuropilin-2 isoform X2 [Nematostella vectensis]|uniref:neuropilin-2 isoform X2 n=1 Tax=Nematostella vectensis TaxID=45351 RepID=UPI002076FE36|nr:neuropilin-2 isoform X2 [Nematostella vectensis]